MYAPAVALACDLAHIAGNRTQGEFLYFEPINRIRAVRARPSGSLKVPNCGEATLLFTRK